LKKVSVIFGTRPEAIKLAPVILGLKEHVNLVTHACVTAQHRQMLDQTLNAFNIVPDVDLDLMKKDQTLSDFTARALISIGKYLEENKPDLLVVQGDTTTVFSAALAAFYKQIPVAHVEAGLRTGNMLSPWPEEANRVLASRLASIHFAPTEVNKQNLIKEGIAQSKIFVTGNTVIDALYMALEKGKKNPPQIEGLPGGSLDFLHNDKMVLITGHRRENFGEGFENICRAIKTLSQMHPAVHFIYPVHLNPNVQEPVYRILGFNQSRSPGNRNNIHLIEPQGYIEFVSLMSKACLILTDSGGVQEEAPSLGKPVLVMRNTTERTEAISGGDALLVGTSMESIINYVDRVLAGKSSFEKNHSHHNPFGDGLASQRIVSYLLNYLFTD